MNITDLLLPEGADGGGGDEPVIVYIGDAVIGVYNIIVLAK